MLSPDYDRSIVNLATALAGDTAPCAELYPPLVELADARISERTVVFLLIDGWAISCCSVSLTARWRSTAKLG